MGRPFLWDGGGKPDFEEIFTRYWNRVVGYIHRKIEDLTEAEDLAEDVFLYAYDHYAQYDPQKSSAATWLYLIVNSRLKNYYRDRRSYADLDALENVLFESGDEMEKAVWLEQLRANLKRALEALPERQREVVEMRYFQEMTHEQIAQALHTTTGNTRVLLSRALDKLKDLYRE